VFSRTLKADGKRLQAFHTQCQRPILGIRWSDFVTNSSLPNRQVCQTYRYVQSSVTVGWLLDTHVRHLPESALAHNAVQVSVELLAGTTSVPDWRRKPGRPRSSWLHGVLKDVQLTAQEAWTAADDHEGWTTKRSFADYAF